MYLHPKTTFYILILCHYMVKLYLYDDTLSLYDDTLSLYDDTLFALSMLFKKTQWLSLD